MIVYVDSSAALKRVVVEPESDALRVELARLASAHHLLASSALTWIEVARALRRAGAAAAEDRSEEAMSGIDEVPLASRVLTRARSIGPAALRSLDAIHLASAAGLGADGVLTYDDRLAAACRDEGIAVLAPAG